MCVGRTSYTRTVYDTTPNYVFFFLFLVFARSFFRGFLKAARGSHEPRRPPSLAKLGGALATETQRRRERKVCQGRKNSLMLFPTEGATFGQPSSSSSWLAEHC